MAPIEEQITRMWRRLARENALLLGMLAEGRSLWEAEEALQEVAPWITCGLRPPIRGTQTPAARTRGAQRPHGAPPFRGAL